MSGSNVLFILTGSVACYKACEAVSRLVQAGHRLRIVATASALRFVGAPTLEALAGSPVLSDLWADGQALEHIKLTRWADLVIICPATANTINRLAAGLGDDLVGALYLAHDRTKPWLIVPAMNPAMWSHPATQAAAEKLRAWGVRFLPAGTGRTACGEAGEGRLAEPEMIVAAVETALHRPGQPLRVLVTSGGTAEPIDGVRVLANTSTGRTGAGLASHLMRCGHEAVLLRARQAARPEAPCREEIFETFADLEAALTRLLRTERFDAVIHAAAVGDFGVESVVLDGKAQPVGAAKLDSRFPPLLQLRENPKLVERVRSLSPTPLKLIAFKLTRGASRPETNEAVRALFAHAGPDWVVQNDLANRRDEAGTFPADIYQPDGSVTIHCSDRTELAAALERLLANRALPL
jgi:phosphopantothenoylcysteine decarboxylase/phosphopantothenate--cysteine ligase